MHLQIWDFLIHLFRLDYWHLSVDKVLGPLDSISAGTVQPPESESYSVKVGNKHLPSPSQRHFLLQQLYLRIEDDFLTIFFSSNGRIYTGTQIQWQWIGAEGKGRQTCAEWKVSTFFHRYKDTKNTFEKASSDHLCAVFQSQTTTVLMNLQRNLVSKYLFLTCIVKMEGKKKVVKCLLGSIYKLNQRYCSKFTAGHLFFFPISFQYRMKGWPARSNFPY